MRPPTLSWVLVSLLGVLHGVQAAWPDGPFSSSGRWIVNTRGEHVTYAGVNWPGAGETMIPEGLQYQSIATIVSKIASLGMNVIRLTYAIEMIDDIFDNGGDVTIADSMAKALGTENGKRVFDHIVENNPQFNSATTRMEVCLPSSLLQLLLLLPLQRSSEAIVKRIWRGGMSFLLWLSCAAGFIRSSMPLPLNASSSASMCTSTTMSPKRNGAAVLMTAMGGSETSIST